MRSATPALALLAAIAVCVGAADGAPMREQLAFARFEPGGTELMLLNSRSGRTTYLLRRRGDEDQPAWSPEGQRIAFATITAGRKQGIAVANADGRRLAMLTSRIFNRNAVVLDAHPRWSPDGRRLLFHRYRSPDAFELFIVGVDGRDLQRLGEGFEPSWAPNGRRIAFAWRPRASANFDIHTARADGTGRRRLTTSRANDLHPDWSRNGRQIVFVRQLLDNHELYVMRADGGRARRMTFTDELEASPVWSPDGRRIAFARRLEDRQWDIFVMNADGSGERRLTRSPLDDVQPAWRPWRLVLGQGRRYG